MALDDNSWDNLGDYLNTGIAPPNTAQLVNEPTPIGSTLPSENGDETSGQKTQTFDDGSTLTTDASGNPVSSTPATDPPAGAVGKDSTGNWIDSAGKILKDAAATILGSPAFAAGIAGLGNVALRNIYSGGAFKEARNDITNALSSVYGVQGADLTNMIPTLQQQVMQGTMTPAQAQAALAQVQGQMQAASMQAAQGGPVGQMQAAQAQIERAVMQGTMTPAQGVAALQDASNMAGVQTDAASLQGQRDALQRLSEIGTQGGMTEADRAQLAATMGATNANAAQQRAAQVQQLQSQGLGGSGAELAARLAGVQGGANANAMAGANVAQAAQARALAAIQAGLQGNAALNQQMFGQEAAKAQAQDVVNQFNTQARNQMELQNMANQQAAAQQNFNMANQIALANQAAANQGNQFNAANQQAANLSNYNMGNQFAMQNLANQQAANQYNAGNQQAANLANYNMGNQFALANQQAQNTANLANAGYGQQANQANFNMANQIAGINTGIANQQAMLPTQLAQQSFTNKMGLAGQQANTGLTAANLLNKQANTQADAALGAMGAAARNQGGGGTTVNVNSGGTTTTGGQQQQSGGGSSTGSKVGSTLGGLAGTFFGGPIGGTIGSALGGLVGNIFSDEELKTDKKTMSDEEVDDMLGKLTAYKYRYKGKGNHTTQGVMAQDMEKTPMRQSVVDTPAGKMVSGDEAIGQSLAALANLSQRLRKLEGKE